ncbi:MAG: SRPBCC family protein [Actinomycetota bacterium]
MNADADKTFSVVADLATYQRWWPEVKRVEQIDEDRADVTITALLPYSLHLRMEREVQDRSAGYLRARLTGDLTGFSSWKVAPEGKGCSLVFEEQVEANKRLLRVLAPVARPAFKLNHSIMMHRGQAGLRRYLAGPL